MGQGAHRNPTCPNWELWQDDMYFRRLPPEGSIFHFINRRIGRAAVVHLGHELGPNFKHGDAGLVPDARWFLKKRDSDDIEIRNLGNTNHPARFGPITSK